MIGISKEYKQDISKELTLSQSSRKWLKEVHTQEYVYMRIKYRGKNEEKNGVKL